MTTRTPGRASRGRRRRVVALIGSAIAMIAGGLCRRRRRTPRSRLRGAAPRPPPSSALDIDPDARRESARCRSPARAPRPCRPRPCRRARRNRDASASASRLFAGGRDDGRRRADARSSARGLPRAAAASSRIEARRRREPRRPSACPRSSVPVLSTTSVSTFSNRSSASAFLISTPDCAPRPTPTMIDIGVASPSAHGQAMMSTDTAATRAKAKRGSGPKIAQAMKASAATAMTSGTNQPDTWSARR